MFQTRKMMISIGIVFAVALLWSQYGIEAASQGQTTYVGSDQCKSCHEKEFGSFKNNAKKAHSYKSIAVMKKGLTDAEFEKCFECHTTGYKKPGGFRSEKETPQLKDAGCEVCHGPGSLHAETGDPKDIKGKLTTKDCETCHNPERVGAFKYKPMVYGGAH